MNKRSKPAKTEQGKQTEDRIKLIQTVYPGYNKAVDSYANRSDQTGVCRTTVAQRLAEAVGGIPVKRRKPCRVNASQITVRLTHEERVMLTARRTRLGYVTDQAFISELLRRELRKEAAT